MLLCPSLQPFETIYLQAESQDRRVGEDSIPKPSFQGQLHQSGQDNVGLTKSHSPCLHRESGRDAVFSPEVPQLRKKDIDYNSRGRKIWQQGQSLNISWNLFRRNENISLARGYTRIILTTKREDEESSREYREEEAKETRSRCLTQKAVIIAPGKFASPSPCALSRLTLILLFPLPLLFYAYSVIILGATLLNIPSRYVRSAGSDWL